MTETWTVRECPSCGLIEESHDGGDGEHYCRIHVSDDESCGMRLSEPFEVAQIDHVTCNCPVGFGQVADAKCPRHGVRSPAYSNRATS